MPKFRIEQLYGKSHLDKTRLRLFQNFLHKGDQWKVFARVYEVVSDIRAVSGSHGDKHRSVHNFIYDPDSNMSTNPYFYQRFNFQKGSFCKFVQIIKRFPL